MDYIRNTEDDQWDGVYGFRPTSGHSPYYFSAAFSRSDGKGSGTKLTLDKFNLDVASSRIHAVYSTANNPTERGAIQANDLIINANNGFLIAAQSYATSGTEGAVVVLNNLDVKKGYIILVNGPAQGVGKLAIGNRLYIGPNSWFRPLNLTGSTTGSVHSGNQTGYLRTKILDLFGQFQANETFNESNRQFIRTSYITDTAYLSASAHPSTEDDGGVGRLATSEKVIVGSPEVINNIAIGKNLVLRGSQVTATEGVLLKDGGKIIVTRNSDFTDANNKINGSLEQNGGEFYIGAPTQFVSLLPGIEGLTDGNVKLEVTDDVNLNNGRMEVNTVAEDLVMFHRDINLRNTYRLINNGQFKISGNLSLENNSYVQLASSNNRLDVAGRLSAKESAQINNSGWLRVANGVSLISSNESISVLINEKNARLDVLAQKEFSIGGKAKIQNKGIIAASGKTSLSSNSHMVNDTGAVFQINGGSLTTNATLTNRGFLQFNGGTFDVSGSLINESAGNIRVGTNASADSSLNISSNFSSSGSIDVYGKANFKGGITTLLGKTNIYSDGSVSITSSSFTAGETVSVKDGANLNLTYSNAGKFFTPGAYQPIPYDVVDGAKASMGKTNAAFADWNESKLTSDSTLNNLQVLSGGKVKVSGASSLNKRQVLELQKAWGQKSNLAEGTLSFTESKSDVNEIKDRLTVKVANEIGATSFLSHSLDGREQQLSSTNTAISDIVSGPKAIVVGTGSSNLKSGFGFKAIEYTTGVTVNSGSELRLFGTRSNPDDYLIRNGSIPGSASVAGTLTLGLPYSFSDVIYGKAEEYGGRLDSLNLVGSLSVVKGSYRIDSLQGTGSVSTFSGSNSKLSIGESSGTVNVSLTPTTTLELKNSGTAEQTLQDIRSNSGSIKSLQGNYSVRNISSPASQTNVALEVGSDDTNSSLAANNITLVGSATVFGNSKLKLGSGSEKNTISTVSLKPNSTLEINKKTEVGRLNASDANFIQTADEIIASEGWFQNSRINLRGGRLLSSNIRDSSGSVTNDLGNNTYVVEGANSSFTSQGANPHLPLASGWDSKYTLLEAQEVTSASDITLKQGGILKARELSLSGSAAKIHMNGGLLSTSMDQFFSSLGYRPVIQLNETSVENVKYGIADVGNIKTEIASGIDGNSGWLVFNDELVLKEAAIAATNRLHTSPSKLTNGVGVEFSGEIEGEFTVDDANQFQNDSRYNHAVVFSETSLYNKTDASGSTNKKVILTGTKGSAGGTNYITANTGFGFSNVFNASLVEVAGGKRFVLTGKEMSPADLGHIHQTRDSSFFSDDAALLPDANGGGILKANGSGSVFSLGSQYANTPRKGWADKFETTSQGKLEVRNGEFALWSIANNGSTEIFVDAYLHSRGISGVGSWKNDGTLYLEDNAASVTGQNTFCIAGNFINSGVLDASDAVKNGVTVASGATLTNESTGSAEFEKLTVNGTAVNRGNERGSSLEVGNAGNVTNVDDSRWGAIQIASGGSYSNTAKLNEDIAGTLKIASGGSLTNGSGAEANFSSTTISSGTSGAKPEILNEGLMKTGVTTTAGKIENRSDMDAVSLAVQNQGLVTNKDSLTVDNQTTVVSGGEIINEASGTADFKQLTVSGSVSNAGSMSATALTANNTQALINNTNDLTIETASIQSGTLNNSGTAKVTGLTIDVGSSGTIVNSGTMIASNAGSMTISSGGIVSNTGEITAEKAALTLAGKVNNDGGKIKTLSMSLNAGILANTGSQAVMETGNIDANSGSKITNGAGASLTGYTYTAVGGVFENKDNSQVALQSANLTNSAQLNNFGSSRVAVEGSIDVANSSITNVGYLKSDAIHLKQSASLINRDSSDAKLDVRVLTSTTGTSVSLQKGQLFAGQADVDGTLQITEGSRLIVGRREDEGIPGSSSTFGEHATVTNSGTIDLQGNLTNEGVINSEHGTISIASGKEFINEGSSIKVENLTGNGVTYTHNKGVLTVTGEWLNSSTVNLNYGVIDTRGAVPSGSSIPGLGNNLYNVSTPNGVIAASGQTGSYNHFDSGDWKNGKTVLIASSLDASSGAVVNVNTGGVFSVENLNLQGAEKHALILNGGAVETTLNQIFVGEGEKAAVGIEQKDPSTPNGLIGGYGDLREGVREGVRVDDQKSWFIFTDENLMATDASSAIAVLSKNNMTSQVGFTGIISGQFNVSDANRFQESVLEDGSTQRDHDVVFYSTVLANQTDEQPSQNSVLVVSNSEASEVNGGKNYLRVSNIGFGFQAVSEAENLEISSGKKFVLVGSSHAGFSHNKGDLTDEQVFDTGHKLLTSSSNGGSIAVKENSELYFGTEFLDGLTSGWVQKTNIESGSSLTVRKGDFASWDLVNNGQITITEGALLHNRKMLSSGTILNQGTLYLEKDHDDGTSGQFALTGNASIINEGLLDASEGQTEITLNGASSLVSEKETIASFSTLTVNEDAKVEIKGDGSGETLNVAGNGSYKIGSTSENTWKDISVAGGLLVNEGVLNPAAEGEEPKQLGNLTVSGGQFVNDGSADFDRLKTIGSGDAGTPAVTNKSGKELKASTLDLASGLSNEGTLLAERTELSGSAVLDNRHTFASETINLNGSSALQNQNDGAEIRSNQVTLRDNSSLMNSEGASAQINTLKANDSSVLANEGLLETTEVALGGTSGVTNTGTLLIKSEESEDPETPVREPKLTLSENAVLNNKSEITNEGKTEITGGELNNSGSIFLKDVLVNGGSLNNLSESSGEGTSLGSMRGTSLTVESGEVNFETGTSNNWETVEINGGKIVNNAGDGENSGSWNVTKRFTVSDGFVTNNGKITGGSDLTLSGGSLTNTGSMGMGEVLVNNGATLINDAHSELTGTKITVADGGKYINDDTAVAHWTEANFSGDGSFKTKADTELRVSDAREFIPGNEIILSEATLVNDQPEEDKYKEDGRGKVTIGNRTPVGEHNYEISAPITVKNIGGKLDKGYKEVHLIEVVDGRKFGLLGSITGKDEPIDTGSADISQRLFVDCGIGGTVRVKDGEFRLGVGFDVGQENQTSKGWIGYGEIFDKGSWTIRGGDYLVKNIRNLGIVQVDNGAILRTEQYSDNPDVVLDGTAGQGFGIRNNGSFIYEGAEHEFSVYGTFVNRGLTNFGTAETLSIGGRLEDYSLIDFAGTDKALKNLEVLGGGSAIAYNRHFGNELNLYEGSLYEVSLTPDKDSEGKVQWKDVRLDGTLKVNSGSIFKLRERGTFSGTGLIANQGSVDLTTAEKASAGAVQNSAEADIDFVDLSLNQHSLEAGSSNAGQMEGRSLSLEAGHNFRQGASGSLSVSELKMEENTILENLGRVEIKPASDGFSPSHDMKGQFINRGNALLAETKQLNIGSEPTADHKVEAKFHTEAGAQTSFADALVKTGSELKNEGQESGKNLVVEKLAAYLIISRGESVWEDVRLEGNATISGGKLQVTTGFLRVENGATLLNDGGTIHAHLIDESHVIGTIINKGEARFNQLTLSEGSESHNYGYQVGKLLLVRSDSTGHNTYEDSRSQWEKVELNEALTNKGSFVITQQLDAKADITNHGTGFLDTSGTQGFITAHNLVNYGEAKHQDVTLGDLVEGPSSEVSPSSDLTNPADPEDQTNLSAVQQGTEPNNPPKKSPETKSDSDLLLQENPREDESPEENTSEKDASGDGSVIDSSQVIRSARMENHGTETGRNLTITGSASYLNTAKTQWQNLTIRDKGIYESTAGEVKLQNFNLEKGQAFVKGGSLETAVNASFKGGSLEVGGEGQYAKAVLLTTPTDVMDSQINIRPYGDVGFGPSSIALADEKKAIAASSGKARLSMSASLTLGANGGMQVGAPPARASVDGLYFGKDSALVMNFAELGPNGALLTSEPEKELVVEPGAELYVNLSGVKKGNYYITRGFNTAANEASDGTWIGGWDKEYLIAIPKESVARWKLFLHHDTDDVWLEAKLAEIPDVEAIEVATEILDTEGEKDYGPGGKFVIEVLNNEGRPVKENAQIYNSFVNLAFAGGQLSTAYSSLNNAAQVLEGRTSMIAENFNRNGYVANKHRQGDLWFETIGKHERVSHYETRKMSGVGYTSTYYGFIGGVDHLFADKNLLTGVAVSYQKGNAKSRGPITNTKNEFETFGAELYGYWSPGPFLNVAGDIGYYRNNADVTQHLGGAGGFAKASADTSTNMITAAIRAESTIKTRLVNIVPHAGVRYILTNTDRYYSKLDGQKAFKNDPHTTSTIQFPLGVGFRADLITKGGWKLRPQLNTSVVLQAGHRKQKILFSTMDEAVNSRIYGQFTGAYAFLASLGLQAEKNNATFGLRYSISAAQGGRVDQALKLEAIWRF